ncbi:MAG: ABC transporter substrate-binding protein [Alphaproteobacteria bacterium]|jgi:peptide/nickel transport system substrate-binding protein|nr:ABC transporter substrate-binding protein [Alphaproteobacteria bacterium]
MTTVPRLRPALLPLVPALAALFLGLQLPAVQAADYIETPMLAEAVETGDLPAVSERLPAVPFRVETDGPNLAVGRHGGEINWLARRAKDIRIMNVYGYARLVGYTRDFDLQPDILESVEVEENRIFTLHLREGHRWSDGHPFTTEDFRYAWENVELNEALSPFGPDTRMIVDGALPEVAVVDETTIRYSWPTPNPEFLPALADARPLYIYAPAHYLQQFHADHADPDALDRRIAESNERNWAALHIRRGDLYDADNPDLPVLQPWRNTTPPPSERFVFVRNPYFHRIDPEGRQLPYLDRVIVNISDGALIPAKTGAGESDLQSRSLRFDNVTFLLEAEQRNDFTVRLWPTALGSEMALYPNMNVNDPVWRAINRDVRFRRALSLAIDRAEINEIIFFGLATPANNTALPISPVFDDARQTLWADYDLERANALLDEMGLTERNGEGIRLLPDGRPMEIVVETSGERTVEIDMLQLIRDSWQDIGVALFTSSSQRDIFRNRVFSGDAMMSTWFGFDNAVFSASTVPRELAPVDQNWLQYPKWGQYVQTLGDAGEPADMDFALRLMTLYDAWRLADGREERLAIVDEMLDIHADQVTSIGTVQGVLQPVVVNNALRNVPQEAIYSWNPGAHFGIYHPDTFWLER